MAIKRKNSMPSKADIPSQAHQGEEYRLYTSGELVWISKEIIDRYSEELLKFVERDDVFFIHQYRQSKFVPDSTWDVWVAKYPKLHQAVAEAKIILGNKRYINSVIKKLDKDVALRDLHMYFNFWNKDVNQYHQDLKNQESAQPMLQIVNLPAAPKTTLESSQDKEKRIADERGRENNSR